MRKPVKKFSGGLIKKLIPAIKEATTGMPREANPGVIKKAGFGLTPQATAAASPSGSGPFPPEKIKGLLRKIAAAKMGRPMKKGGVVTKKAVKKTVRKK
jgi:hypothetical protein